jgi:ribonuclease HI
MKTLKLDHELATQVLKGENNSTWRMYDDKDLSVNDEVKLLDKVDPQRPETWKIIGMAQIKEVIQKRLGDISENDYNGHREYKSTQQILDEFKGYYGNQVSLDTPIKIIRFNFNNNQPNQDNIVVELPSKLQIIKLYADGGSRGNPGPSASGFVIMDMDNNIVVKKGVYLGITTNNQAEYQALKFGLEEAARMQAKEVHVFLDSLLVVNQMLGIFKVRNRDLWPIHESVKQLASKFKKVHFTHVPRELNKNADSAVNEALDEAANK